MLGVLPHGVRYIAAVLLAKTISSKVMRPQRRLCGQAVQPTSSVAMNKLTDRLALTAERRVIWRCVYRSDCHSNQPISALADDNAHAGRSDFHLDPVAELCSKKERKLRVIMRTLVFFVGSLWAPLELTESYM